jgi:endonuclease/exonuclease/phosphatase (EEP) superfamily protein YafD
MLKAAMGLARLAANFLFGPPLVLLAMVCAGAALGAQHGRVSLAWDLLAQFAPVWLAGAAAATLGGLVLLRGFLRLVVVALGATGMIAAGALIAPELTRSTGPTAPADAPGRLKIIQFNVWNRNADLPRTVDWIVAQDPDVVVLEETTPRLRRLIEARTRWWSVCRDCEVMIYSREHPTAGSAAPRLGGPSPGPLAHATFEDARGRYTVIGVHDAWPMEAQHAPQEARLARVIAAYPRATTIVTGDFNSTPWSFARRRWDAAFGLIRRDRALFPWPAGQAIGGRYAVPFPILPIDHVYAGSAWAIVEIRRGPVLGSDHYPVVVTLAPVVRP